MAGACGTAHLSAELHTLQHRLEREKWGHFVYNVILRPRWTRAQNTKEILPIVMNVPPAAEAKPEQIELPSPEQLGQVLKATSAQHPALSRVRARLTASTDTGGAITSYDRMHHRHSRS